MGRGRGSGSVTDDAVRRCWCAPARGKPRNQLAKSWAIPERGDDSCCVVAGDAQAWNDAEAPSSKDNETAAAVDAFARTIVPIPR
jgi:hypothetical protein